MFIKLWKNDGVVQQGASPWRSALNMLATGGSLIAAISLLKRHGCKQICSLNLVCAPEGIAKVKAAHPDVDIYTAAIDDHLNENGYIIPGLGDAGDRIFGTK